MNCRKCNKVVEMTDKNIRHKVVKSYENRVEIALVCDTKGCGHEVAFSFVGESEFI